METQEVKKPNGAPPPIPPDTPKKNLFQKLAEVVTAIDHVEKGGVNDFQKYRYVKATDIARAVRLELSRRNVYLVSDVVEVRNYEIPAREGVMQAVDIKMQFSFFDGDDTAVPPIVLHSMGTGTDKGDKAVYKAMTGALKYGLRNAFLIPDESDPEADTKTDKATAAKEIGKRKVQELKERMGVTEEAVTVLFYTKPAKHNGYFAEFVNIKGYFAAHLDQEEVLRLLFTKYGAKKTKDDTALVPTTDGKLDGLLQDLAGSLGITVKELKGAERS